MNFEYAITVRSQPDLAADYGRALERVAFFPGVTDAKLIGEGTGSVTIGYNGRACERTSRKFCSDLEADGLMADRALWEARDGSDESLPGNAISMVRRKGGQGQFQSIVPGRVFDRRA